MFLAVSPYVTVAIVLVVILAVTSGYAYMANKGQSREAAMNEQIAQQAGVRYIHRSGDQPRGYVDVYGHKSRMASHYAFDPQTNDKSMQMFYNIPPTGIHARRDMGENFNVSVASVWTGMWLINAILIFPKARIGRYKGRYLTGNEEFDSKWVVASLNQEQIPAVLTPGVVNAIMHPPFPFGKKTKITFRGPEMTIETDLVEFEKRVQLLRWCQNLIKQIDTRNAPYFGAYAIEPQQSSGTDLPYTVFNWASGEEPAIGQDVDPSEFAEDSA